MHKTTNKKKLGIIFAMKEEQDGLENQIKSKTILQKGNRRYISGNLWGQECVSVLSGIGKVAAASTVTCLLETFEVTQLVLIGTAGAINEELKIGDIVIAEHLIQHDMNAAPLFPQFEIPLTGKTYLETDAELRTRLAKASEKYIDQIKNNAEENNQSNINFQQIKTKIGLIGSGDQFINCKTSVENLKKLLPELLVVEMEGAAIAQVCLEYQIPFAVLRIVSDNANKNASIDFNFFVKEFASKISIEILKNFTILNNSSVDK